MAADLLSVFVMVIFTFLFLKRSCDAHLLISLLPFFLPLFCAYVGVNLKVCE